MGAILRRNPDFIAPGPHRVKCDFLTVRRELRSIFHPGGSRPGLRLRHLVSTARNQVNSPDIRIVDFGCINQAVTMWREAEPKDTVRSDRHGADLAVAECDSPNAVIPGEFASCKQD